MTCKSCGPHNTAGPKPYYEEVKASVVENHETVLQKTVHAVGVRVLDAWNVPQETKDITVRLEDVTVLPVGSYLFHPNYGYYRISQWNPKTNQAGLTHDKINGNAGAGTFVPARTAFLVSPKPCCQGGQEFLYPFLAEDFKTPFVGQSVIIDVTSTFGLNVGDYIRIGEGVYRLDTLNSTKRIQISNRGAGSPANTQVKAQDSQGEYQHLITVEPSFICTVNTQSNHGKILVCDGAEERLLGGNALGQVPTLIDPITGQVEFRSIGAAALLDNSITTPKIVDGAVTQAKLANASVGTVQLVDASVTNAKLAPNSVSTANISDQNITNQKMASNSVGLGNYIDLSINDTKLANNAVTALKLAGLGVYSTYTPQLLYTSLTEFTSTLAGKYWQFGPLVFVYISGGVTSTVDNSGHVYFSLPVNGIALAGDVRWPIARIGINPTDKGAFVHLGADGTDHAYIFFDNLFNTQSRTVDVFLMYPSR